MTVRDATPALLAPEYWQKNRCPWCGSGGMFTHALGSQTLVCDACDVMWSPLHTAHRLSTILVELGRQP